jgi:endoglycosylceramidase
MTRRLLGGSVATAGALAAIVLAAPSCSSSSAPAPSSATGVLRTDPDAVHVVGSTFRDGRGRQLLFRGYNSKTNGIFDATFTDGRTPNEVFPDFDEWGATRFEELGFSVMRLPMNWSAIEPQPLQYSETFFDKVAAVLAFAHEHHFYVIMDMHQDAYSKEIGEDGQPLWAIVPPPTMILQGPSDDSRRESGQVLAAGFSFFANANATDGRPLQQAYITAVQQVVKRFVGDSAILGWEAFNEPVILKQSQLDSFHEAFADGVHAIDADAPVLFEPVGTRNESDSAQVPDAPWSHGPGAYAVHIYTGQFSIPDQMGWASEDPNVLAPSMSHAVLEAAGWATPMFVTEFGCDVSQERGSLWLQAELDLQDQYLASSTVWAWEPGDWGFRVQGTQERPQVTHTVSRMYPRAVSGDLVAIQRKAPSDMVVQYNQTAATLGQENEVSVSADYVVGVSILCDGKPVPFAPATGRATFVCPGSVGPHTFEVIGEEAL